MRFLRRERWGASGSWSVGDEIGAVGGAGRRGVVSEDGAGAGAGVGGLGDCIVDGWGAGEVSPMMFSEEYLSTFFFLSK